MKESTTLRCAKSRGFCPDVSVDTPDDVVYLIR